MSGDLIWAEEIKQVTLAEQQQFPVSEWFSAPPWFATFAKAADHISLFLALLEMARAELVQIKEEPGLGGALLMRIPLWGSSARPLVHAPLLKV